MSTVVDFRTVVPGRVSTFFVTVVVDLPGRMKLRGLEAERVSVILTERFAGCLPGAPRETVLDFLEITVPVVTDCLFITIGRVIRVVLGETRVLFELTVKDLGAIAVRVDFLVIVVVERPVGATVTVLFERVVICLDVVGVERLFTMTGRVMRVVFDEVMVRFELVAGDLYVVVV